MRFGVSLGGKTYNLELATEPANEKAIAPNGNAGVLWNCKIDGREVSVNAIQIARDSVSLLIAGESFTITRQVSGGRQQVVVRGAAYEASVEDRRSLLGHKRSDSDGHGVQQLVASMPGRVVRLLASEGQKIAAGQGILVVEAMKMQNEIRSPKEGVLKKLLAREDGNVNAGDVLAIVE
jgi:biotin carboxyl carrier protein